MLRGVCQMQHVDRDITIVPLGRRAVERPQPGSGESRANFRYLSGGAPICRSDTSMLVHEVPCVTAEAVARYAGLTSAGRQLALQGVAPAMIPARPVWTRITRTAIIRSGYRSSQASCGASRAIRPVA